LFVVLELLKPRAKKLTDFVELGRYFFVDEPTYDPGAIVKHLRSEGMAGHLEAVEVALAALPEFDAETAESALRAVAEARGVKAASLIHALRVALTGRSASPGLFEVAVLLGRPATRTRIARAVRELTAPPS
jgi:glutamyl-tRNA synthetase